MTALRLTITVPLSVAIMIAVIVLFGLAATISPLVERVFFR